MSRAYENIAILNKWKYIRRCKHLAKPYIEKINKTVQDINKIHLLDSKTYR